MTLPIYRVVSVGRTDADGQVVAAQTTPLFVSRAGVSAEVYEFAHREAALYGGGLSFDTPPNFFFSSQQAYRDNITQQIQWAVANANLWGAGNNPATIAAAQEIMAAW